MNAVKENSGKHKAWWAPVWQGLVMDPNAKHYQRMGQAVWLFLYFLLNANRRTGLLMRRSSTITAQTGYKPRTIRQCLRPSGKKAISGPSPREDISKSRSAGGKIFP